MKFDGLVSEMCEGTFCLIIAVSNSISGLTLSILNLFYFLDVER